VADNFTGLVEFLPAALIGLHRASERQPAGLHPRQLLMTGMLTLWSLRLGLFLLGRMFSRSGPVRHPLVLACHRLWCLVSCPSQCVPRVE
jgi:steroid 5-alpha reductase family enzyme